MFVASTLESDHNLLTVGLTDVRENQWTSRGRPFRPAVSQMLTRSHTITFVQTVQLPTSCFLLHRTIFSSRVIVVVQGNRTNNIQSESLYTMFTDVYGRLQMFTDVYRCLLTFTDVY